MDPTLKPVMATMRVGLHMLVVLLGVVPIVSAWHETGGVPWAVIAAVSAVWGVYAVGGWALTRGRQYTWWIALLAVWGVLLFFSSQGAYLAFPFALLAGATAGVGAMATAGLVLITASVVSLGPANTWSFPGIVGPIVGIAVAILVGRGYRMLAAAVVEHEQLVSEVLKARKQAEDQARRAGMLEERARVSRELHDTVSQSLSSIQMLIHAARRVEDPGARDRHLDAVQDAAASSLSETRQIIAALAPAGLDEDGLGPALRRLGERLHDTTGADVTVEVDHDDSLPVDTEAALLRIAQGAGANVEQHAHASRIEIRLSRVGGAVVLQIADDGIGFAIPDSHDSLSERGSFGLSAMRERAAQLGGAVDVDSTLGVGTTVTARWEVNG